MTKLGAVLLVLALLVPGAAPAQSRPPIKIGFLTDLTGIAAQPAKDMVNGLTLYLDEIGHQMAGRKIELIVEDTQGRPDVSLTKLRKVVEHDRVHLVAGVLFGHLGYALAPKVEEYRIPTLITVAASDDLTQRLKYSGWSGPAGRRASRRTRSASTPPRRSATRRSRHRLRLRVRVGGGRRLPEDVRGERRPGDPEALGAAGGDGPRALHLEDPA